MPHHDDDKLLDLRAVEERLYALQRYAVAALGSDMNFGTRMYCEAGESLLALEELLDEVRCRNIDCTASFHSEARTLIEEMDVKHRPSVQAYLQATE